MAEKSKTEFTVAPDEPLITMRRTFDAPRRIVFEASTQGEYMKQWYGPREYEIVSAETDLSAGGRWRIVHRDADGQEYGFHGVYRAIEVPRMIEYTWIYEGWPDQEVIETAVYEETNGKTTMTTTSRFPTMTAREKHLKAGAEAGARESWDRLAELIKTLHRPAAEQRPTESRPQPRR